MEAAKLLHDTPPRYHAFMLRCWEVRTPAGEGPVTWRFSLEDPETRERFGFADMEAFLAFLNDTLVGSPAKPGTPGP